MKTIVPCIVMVAFARLADGQEPASVQTAHDVPPANESTAKVVGDNPTGFPVETKPTVPSIHYEDADILETRTLSAGQRSITFQKVNPLVLPEAQKAPAAEESGERRDMTRVSAVPHKLVMLGGTVFIPEDNPDDAVTYLRSWSAAGAEPIGVWLKADARILSGFATYGNDSGTWDLILVLSEAKVRSSAEIRNHVATEYGEPELSSPTSNQFDERGISFVGGDPGAEHATPINALMDLYRTDKERLRAAYAGRAAASEEQARLRAADPPEKKNMIIRYWRLDAAGQAGRNAKPADIR